MVLLDLVVLAGGLGTRYQSAKQFEEVGPQKQLLVYYSLCDAYLSGFSKAIFVLHRNSTPELVLSLQNQFQTIPIELEFVFQSALLLEGHPYCRDKPWGTTHALWSVQSKTTNPFLVINSDDFYGRAAFVKAAQMLQLGKMGVISYPLCTTISQNGGVSRGICTTNYEGKLENLQEIQQIQYEGNTLWGTFSLGKKILLTEDTPTSMNLFCLQPLIWGYLQIFLQNFAKTYHNDLEKECYLSEFIGNLSQQKSIWVEPSESSWFGITYPQDKISVQKELQKLHEKCMYPPHF